MIRPISKWITHHTKLLVITALLLVIPSLFGYVKTRTNYDVLSYLPSDDLRG